MEGRASRHKDLPFSESGTPKSGTSWWYELLLNRPDVVGNRLGQKELAYFYHFTFRQLTDDQVRTLRVVTAITPVTFRAFDGLSLWSV
jgi:hypothetical protein